MSPIRRPGFAVLAAFAWGGVARAETMPQLDFGNPANKHLLVAQIVWGALIFGVFYGLVSRWGLPKVGAVLEMRAQTIAGDLDQARTAKAQADQAAAELHAARAASHAQSQAAIALATKTAKDEAAASTVEQDRRLEVLLADSEAQIGRARSAAMGALRQLASETAMAVVARVTNRQADEARLSDAVGHILYERGLAS